MHILLNGTSITSISEVTSMMKGIAPDEVNVVEWSDYEENIEFEPLLMTYGYNILELQGYNGMYEMLSYNKLSKESQIAFSNDMLEWIGDEIKYNN